MTNTIQPLIDFADTLPGAEVYYRDSWECYYFSLLGKSFGQLKPTLITLKGEPEANIALRDLYTDVVPGYYANKVHWNSVNLPTEELSTEEIKKMIETSYTLVFNKLTKKEKALINGSVN